MYSVDPNQGKVVKLDTFLSHNVTTGSNLKHTVDDLHEYVVSELIFLLLDQSLRLETCLGISCSVDMFQGSTIIL